MGNPRIHWLIINFLIQTTILGNFKFLKKPHSCPCPVFNIFFEGHNYTKTIVFSSWNIWGVPVKFTSNQMFTFTHSWICLRGAPQKKIFTIDSPNGRFSIGKIKNHLKQTQALDINWPNIWSFHVLQPTFFFPLWNSTKQKRQVWINYTNPPDWNRFNNIISSPKPNGHSSDVALGLVPIYLSTSSRDGRRLKSQKTVWYNDY